MLLLCLTPYADEISGNHQCEFWCNIKYWSYNLLMSFWKNGHKMEQCISYLQALRRPIILLGGMFCIMSSLNLVSHRTGYIDKNVFKWNPQLSGKVDIRPMNFLFTKVSNVETVIGTAVQQAIWKVQANQVELKWTRIHQLLVCADDVNLLADIQITQKNTDTWVASMDIGLDIAENTKYSSCLMKRMQ